MTEFKRHKHRWEATREADVQKCQYCDLYRMPHGWRNDYFESRVGKLTLIDYRKCSGPYGERTLREKIQKQRREESSHV